MDSTAGSLMVSSSPNPIFGSTERLVLPEPMGALRPVRTETQRWQRISRAEGELTLGWDAADKPVRIEYHWIRRISESDPSAADIYTAELFAKRPTGDWSYMLLPGKPVLHTVEHDQLRPLLLKHLGVDIG